MTLLPGVWANFRLSFRLRIFSSCAVDLFSLRIWLAGTAEPPRRYAAPLHGRGIIKALQPRSPCGGVPSAGEGVVLYPTAQLECFLNVMLRFGKPGQGQHMRSIWRPAQPTSVDTVARRYINEIFFHLYGDNPSKIDIMYFIVINDVSAAPHVS